MTSSKKKIRKDFLLYKSDVDLVKAILSGSKISEAKVMRKALRHYLKTRKYVEDFPELIGGVSDTPAP